MHRLIELLPTSSHIHHWCVYDAQIWHCHFYRWWNIGLCNAKSVINYIHLYCVLSFKFQPVLRVICLYPRTSKLRTADLIDRLEKWNKVWNKTTFTICAAIIDKFWNLIWDVKMIYCEPGGRTYKTLDNWSVKQRWKWNLRGKNATCSICAPNIAVSLKPILKLFLRI